MNTKKLREPELDVWYTSKELHTEYKVIYYSKEKQMVTYRSTDNQQHTISVQNFKKKIAAFEYKKVTF